MTTIGTFIPQSRTDLQVHSELALFILNYLEQQRDVSSGSWPHAKETRHLRYTCHAVDAISELRSARLNQRLVDRALDWLCDLPILRKLPAEERPSIRLYPSRFKTLITQDRFRAPGVRADFDELRKYFDPQSGWLVEVPGGLNRTLATLIWADTLITLRQKEDITGWATELDTGLHAIHQSFTEWLEHHFSSHGDAANLSPTSFTRLSDASYAFDLLMQSAYLTPQMPMYQQSQLAFCQAVQARSQEQMQNADLLYCGLQLARYGAKNQAVRNTLVTLLRDVQSRYESGEYNHDDDHFHALVLRLLINFYGDELRDGLLDTLLQRDKERVVQYQKDQALKQQYAFEDLILKQTRAELSPPDRLSGSEERGAVYRVRFRLRSDATYDDGRPFSLPRDALRLIIKKGSYDALLHSIEQYQKLPESLRSHFAKHTYDLAQFGDTQEWYLVMEDLADMTPLCETLLQIDPQVPTHTEQDQIHTIAGTVSQALQALHTNGQHAPMFGDQFWRLYYVPITESIERLCNVAAYPNLKRYLTSRFVSNGWRYRHFNSYLDALRRHADKLHPPVIGLVHGDCHSRNLMLDDTQKHLKFVDLEMFRDDDDYLVDYALLLEDVAIYLYLPHVHQPRGLLLEEIEVLPEQDPQSHQNAINYPLLPRDSEVMLIFQRALMQRLREYARRLGDDYWKERLWLAIVRNLLVLGSRQLHFADKESQRQEERYRSVLVCFAEAIRLLSELAGRLDMPSRGDLPEIPFMGQPRQPLPPPFPIKELRRAIMVLDPDVTQSNPPHESYVTLYAYRQISFLAIRSGAKGKDVLSLVLYGQWSDFSGLLPLTQFAKDAPEGIQIQLTSAIQYDDIVNLIRQSYQMAKAKT